MAQNHPAQKEVKPGLIGRVLGFVFAPLGILIVGLLSSIVVEIIGMIWFWPEQGVNHSMDMLRQEIHYVNQDIQQSLLVENPSIFALHWSNNAYEFLFVKTGITQMIRELSFATDYFVAALVVVQIYFLRLVILLFAMPIFVAIAFPAVIDGLVRRELRKYGAGKESGFIYHHSKRFAVPCVFLSWIVYLSMPFSVRPEIIIVPFALLFAASLTVSIGSFKKYL